MNDQADKLRKAINKTEFGQEDKLQTVHTQPVQLQPDSKLSPQPQSASKNTAQPRPTQPQPIRTQPTKTQSAQPRPTQPQPIRTQPTQTQSAEPRPAQPQPVRTQPTQLRAESPQPVKRRLPSSVNGESAIKKKIKPAKVFTITSGKGGVGKTNITVNLAVALVEMGYKVGMLDADFGLSNIEILLGVSPKFSLFDFLHKDMSINEILCDGPMGIKFISGGSGVEELMKINAEHLPEIIANLSILDKDFDIILIDTGAGLTDTIVSMALAADEIVLITTPEPTSVTDAYALVKTIAYKDREKAIKIIVNKAENPFEAIDVLSKLIVVAGGFLDLKLQKLGYILSDGVVPKSVKQQQPFILRYPGSQASNSVRRIAESLISVQQGADVKKNAGITGFVRRITRVFNMHY